MHIISPVIIELLDVRDKMAGHDYSLGSKNMYIFFIMLFCFPLASVKLNLTNIIEGLGNAGVKKFDMFMYISRYISLYIPM